MGHVAAAGAVTVVTTAVEAVEAVEVVVPVVEAVVAVVVVARVAIPQPTDGRSTSVHAADRSQSARARLSSRPTAEASLTRHSS